jgi:hypothetical protein
MCAASRTTSAFIAPNYNAAPGDPQPVIGRSRDTGERELSMTVSPSSFTPGTMTVGSAFSRVAIRGLRSICCIPTTPAG